MLFGVASNYERLLDSITPFAHWLGNTGARLLAVVDDKDITNSTLDFLATEYLKNGIELIPVRPQNSSFDANEQHFILVRDLLRHANDKTRWATIIDDDTFFPSLSAMVPVLNAHDPLTSIYLGGLSESSTAVRFHGYMAYGGASVFLSMPLIQELEPKIDECLDEIKVRQGDGLLKQCIYNKTDTRLTVVPGLHQLDMEGDLSGFYESGQLPLSLHHWKSWHSAPVDKMTKIVEFCGGCFMQRWRFGPDTVLSNGYSIASYQGGIEHDDLAQLEGTWKNALDYDDTMGPMREKTEPGRKKSYLLIDSEKIGQNLRQLYVHRAPDTSEKGKMMDEIVEVMWEWPVGR